MRILAIDTSTMMGSVALTDEARLVAQEQLGVEVTHSERLILTIEHLLQICRWPKESLDGVAVAVGPGSFTGLRIGLATAKGIALGLKKPIVGVSSLMILAYNGLASMQTVVPVIDARREQVYAAAYRFQKAKSGSYKPVSVMEELAVDPAVLCRKLKSLPGKLLLVGDGVAVYEKIFARLLKDKAVFLPGEFKFPHASYLGMIAGEKLKKGTGDDIATLAPNYIRRSDAEIGFAGKGKAAGRKPKKVKS